MVHGGPGHLKSQAPLALAGLMPFGREGPFFRVRRGLFAPSLLSNSAGIVGGDRQSTTRPHPARSHQLIVRSGLASSQLSGSVTRIHPEQAHMHRSQLSPQPPFIDYSTLLSFFVKA